METTLVKVNPVDYGLDEKKATELIGNLPQIKDERKVLEVQYEEIIKLDIELLETQQRARDLRLLIQKNRTQGIMIWHKTTKDFFLRGGQFVDAIKRKEIAINERMENGLEEIEKYAEIQEQLRLEKLQSDRAEKLSKYIEDAHERNLASMDEDVWKAYFSTKKQEYEDRIAAEKKAEDERKENERLDKIENARRLEVAPFAQFINKAPELRMMEQKDYDGLLLNLKKAKADYDIEQERIRKENDRIKKEQERKKKIYVERSAKLEGLWNTMPDEYANANYIEMSEKDFAIMLNEAKASRQKAEAERKAREEKKRKEREAFEAKLKKEREERQKAEAEIKARQQAEEDARQKDEEEKRRAELAPDKDKLLAFAARLEQIEIPEVDSDEADEILSTVVGAVINISKTIRHLVKERL